MKLRRTFVAVVLVLAVVLGLVVGSGFQLYTSTIEEHERDSLQATADMTGSQLDVLIGERIQSVEILAADPAIDGDPAERRAALERFVGTTEFQGVSVIDDTGTMVDIESEGLTDVDRESLVGEDFSDRDYYQAAIAGTVYVSDPVEAETGNHIVTVSVPVERNGEIQGTVNAALHLTDGTFFDAIAPDPEEDLSVSVISADGDTLYATEPAGEDLVVANVTVQATDWTVSTARPEGAMMGPIQTATWLQIGAIGIVLITLVGFAAWTYRVSLRQLTTLQDGLDRLADREYGIEIDLGAAEELAAIESRFNAVSAELQRHERELSESLDRLERSRAELAQFTKVAYHDLQEPLRMVTAHLSLIEEEVGEDLDPELQDSLDHAQQGALRMKHLVDDLAAYTEINEADATPEQVDTDAIIERVVTNVEDRLDIGDITVEREDLSPVYGVESQLVQLFLNLVSNAIEHGGTTVTITGERTDGTVTIQVADDGPGISAAQQGKIFDLFTRGDRSDETKTGIGLAVAKRIATAHGGDITVNSTVGEGATFVVTLPAPPSDP